MTLDFWEGKRVLITGHTGFKGSWLSLILERLGAKLFGFSLAPSPHSLFNLIDTDSLFFSNLSNHCFSDLRDQSVLADFISHASPDVVFHLAAQPLVRQSYLDPIGTWSTNVMGTINLLYSLKSISNPCSVVIITTDKVYENRTWPFGYRESDVLGGHDPYSASKAAVELAVNSWRASFVGSHSHQQSNLFIATARAGNVIGGGDYALDRLIPDIIRSITSSTPLHVRNPNATRPWQHVLDPLFGYMNLAQKMFASPSNMHFCNAYNFGPSIDSNKSVMEVINMVRDMWPCSFNNMHVSSPIHEANLLHLSSDKAFHLLNWSPKLNFSVSISRTIDWYRACYNNKSPYQLCLADIDEFLSA